MTHLIAYLDPGSGSALVGTVIAVAGAGLYSLKSFFYRLVRKSTPEEIEAAKHANPDVAIFSEGKNYWGTFKEIISGLIGRKVHFAYYTMDLHDPALLIDSEYMHSRLFDKNKVASFHKIANIKAKILLATTPNIGTTGYPLARPLNVRKLIHIFHAFADISAYHIGSLDNYDIVFTVGPHQEKPIREVEKARRLNPKTIIPIGLPYFDAQYHEMQNVATCAKSTSKIRVLVAPSWGAKGLLAEYGTDFILKLANAGYDVIVRPHPQSYIAELEFIEECKKETSKCANVVWDSETIGTKSMLASDILISDTSSVRFDYAFLYEKPVITLEIPRERQIEYEGQFMSEIWTDSVVNRLGRVVGHESIGNIAEIVNEIVSTDRTYEELQRFRDEVITNLGTSAKVIVDKLLSFVEG